MPEYDELDEENDANPGNLRAALKKAQKEKADAEKAQAEMQKQIADLTKLQAGQTIAQLLQAKGVSPKAAKFLQNDNVEATPEAVDAWLTENGEFFNIKSGDDTPTGESATAPSPASGDYAAVLAALQANSAMGQESSATQNAQEQVLLGKLSELGQNVKSEADITAALRALGAPVVTGY